MLAVHTSLVEPLPRCRVRYISEPFQREPDFGACSVNYDWQELWQRGGEISR